MTGPRRSGKPDNDSADDASGDDATCAGCNAPHRSQFDFSPFEHRVLDFVRLILDMHRNQSASAWITALDLAERADGPFDGPYVIARVTTLTRALLAERRRPYAYMTAGCMHLSSDEIDLMRVVKLARTGGFSEFKAAAQTLAGCNDVSGLLGAAMSLARPDEVRRAAGDRALDVTAGENRAGRVTVH